jgi:hypothetical protein
MCIFSIFLTKCNLPISINYFKLSYYKNLILLIAAVRLHSYGALIIPDRQSDKSNFHDQDSTSENNFVFSARRSPRQCTRVRDSGRCRNNWNDIRPLRDDITAAR